MNPDAVVAAAREWIGTPYRHRAATLGAGCDCLGLVRGVWQRLYGRPPPLPLPAYRADLRDPDHVRSLLEAAETLLLPADAEAPAAGQVVLFRLNRTLAPKHCAILVGDGRFVHAQERLGVVEAHLTEGWARRIDARFRFP